MAVVQSSGTNFGGVTSATRTFSPSPTSGNLLVMGVSMSSAPTGYTDPSGWTKYASLESGNLRTWLYYKYSDGTEATVGPTWSSGGGFGSINIKEFDDDVTGAPIVAENEGSSTTVVSSISTGTAVATASSGLALAAVGGDSFSSVDDVRTWSNSFSELSYDGSGSRAALGFASKAITATGNYETTFGVTDVGDEMYAAIALFQPAAGTTVSVTAATYPFAPASIGVNAETSIGVTAATFPFVGASIAVVRDTLVSVTAAAWAWVGASVSTGGVVARIVSRLRVSFGIGI